MQIADISLKDGGDVARTFVPTIKNGLSASYVNRIGSRPAVYPTVTVDMRQPKAGVNRKVTLKVIKPFDVTVGDVTRVEQVTVFIDVIVPSSAAESAIDDAVTFASGLLLNAQVTDAVVNGAFPY